MVVVDIQRALLAALAEPEVLDSREGILWEIEHWTEDYLVENIRDLSPLSTKIFEKLVEKLEIDEKNRFLALNEMKSIQNLCFKLLSKKSAHSTKKLRKRDIYGTPEYEAHRKFMREYMSSRNKQKKGKNGG